MQPRFPAILASAAFSVLILLSVPARGQDGRLHVEVDGPHSGIIGLFVQFTGRVTLDGSPVEGAQTGAQLLVQGIYLQTYCTVFTDADGRFECTVGPLNFMPSTFYSLHWTAGLQTLPLVPLDWSFTILGAPTKMTYTGPTSLSASDVPTWTVRLDSAIDCSILPGECHTYAFLLEGEPVDFNLDIEDNAVGYLCRGYVSSSLEASCSGWGAILPGPGAHTVFARFVGDPYSLAYWGPSATSSTVQVSVPPPPPPPLPISKDECKNGGWQRFGVFKNQGDCVSFVATKGKH